MRRFGSYLELILGSFFRWWWALVTGVASLLGFYVTRDTGWTLTPAGVLLLVAGLSVLLFLTISVVYRGWELFSNIDAPLMITSIQRNEDPNELGSEWIFVFEGDLSESIGIVVDVHRQLGEVEVPFALVEIKGRTARGGFQGVPLHMSPAHLRDFNDGKFGMIDLSVHSIIRAGRFDDYRSMPSADES